MTLNLAEFWYSLIRQFIIDRNGWILVLQKLVLSLLLVSDSTYLPGSYGCRITWSPKPGGGNSSACRLEVFARAGPAVTPPLSARAVRAATLPASLHLSPPPALAARLDIVGTAEVLEQLRVRDIIINE